MTADGVVANKGGSIANLKIVKVSEPNALTNAGANLFTSTKPLPVEANPTIAVGAIEHSNVQPVLAMSRLIEINRAYTTLASIMQHLDDTQKSAIERLAAVPA